MKRIIVNSVLLIVVTLITIISYLSFVGIETKRFNEQIENQIKNIDENLEIEIKKIKLVLDPIDLKILVKTINPKIKNGEKILEIENIKTEISLNSIINNQFFLTNLEISTQSLEIKNLISFIRLFKNDPRLYILESFVKGGYLVSDIFLEFDSNGKLKDNFIVKGFVADAKVSTFNKYEIDKLKFNFNLEKKVSVINDLSFNFNNLPFSSNKVSFENKNKSFFINGTINNENIEFKKETIDNYIKDHFSKIEIKKINFNSSNNFSLYIDKKLNIDNFKLKSSIKLNDLTLRHDLKLEKFLPDIKKDIRFHDHDLEILYDKSNFEIAGSGKIILQNYDDNIVYSVNKRNEKYLFNTLFKTDENPLIIDFLNFKKNKNSKLEIKLSGSHILDKQSKISNFSLIEEKNKMILKDLILDKKFKIESLKSINLNYSDLDNIKNHINIFKKDNIYKVEGLNYNADKLIENLLNDNQNNFEIFKKKFDFELDIKKINLDKKYYIKNLKGKLSYKKNEVINANLNALFTENKKFELSIKSSVDEKVTTLFLDESEPIVTRYKFIKGFEGGSLDFYSSEQGKKTNSTLKIYDFKLKELPALTKLLTLASLQGIADILSGEGIRFKELEMNFENQGNLMTINEIYAIGPAISILIDGYIEKNKIISLRGTLVPATTINKTIGSIPILGNILVGKKVGEGVFGVSFKIKGPPNNLETSVNPIKTLTPRFITRTLEKIKKN